MVWAAASLMPYLWRCAQRGADDRARSRIKIRSIDCQSLFFVSHQQMVQSWRYIGVRPIRVVAVGVPFVGI